jgi:hypothetical protein
MESPAFQPKHGRRALFGCDEVVLLHQGRCVYGYRLAVMNPLQPLVAFGIALQAPEPRFGKAFAQVLSNGAGFKQVEAVIHEARYAPERMYREICSRTRRRELEGHLNELERNPQLVQEPEHAHRPCLGTVIELEHGTISCSSLVPSEVARAT